MPWLVITFFGLGMMFSAMVLGWVNMTQFTLDFDSKWRRGMFLSLLSTIGTFLLILGLIGLAFLE